LGWTCGFIGSGDVALVRSKECTSFKLAAALFILMAVFGLQTQADDVLQLHGQRITAVRFSPIQPNESELLRYVEIHPGDKLSIQGVRRSIKLLYHLGLFGQVRALAHVDAAGVEITFVLQPIRRVLLLEFVGNDAIGKSELIRMVPLARGDEYDHGTIESAGKDILALYRKRGYRRTQVIPRADGPENGDVEVRYYIQEGPVTRISGITFTGQLAFDTRKLSEVTGIDPGDRLDEERLQKAIKRLVDFYHQAGYLEAVVRLPAISEPLADHEQEPLSEELTIDIQSGPRISFSFVGNSVIREKTLLEALDLQKQANFSSYRLRDLTDRLLELYHKRGFARARISTTVVEEQKPSGKKIAFTIDEGHRVVVRRIQFVGNQAFDNDHLRGFIGDAMLDALQQPLFDQPIDRGDVDILAGGYPVPSDKRRANWPKGFWFDLDPEMVYLREPYENALGKIKDLYQSQGFLDVEVGEPVLSFDRGGTNLYIAIPITEGPQTILAAVSFGGNQAFTSDELVRLAEDKSGLVRPGKPLDLYGVEELRKELVRAYARRGYIYCQVTKQVKLSEDRTVAEVLFEIKEGEQVRVRRVLIRGDVITKRKVFEHTIRLQPGRIYSPEEATLSQEDLLELGIFSNVDIKLLEPENPEPEKDIVVYVREQFPHGLTFSPGISSGEGVRMELEYNQRNLFGYALEFVGRARVNYQVFYSLLSEPLRTRYENLSFWEGLGGWVLTGLHWPRVWWLGRSISARMDLVGVQDHALSYDLTKVSLIPGTDIKITPQVNLTFEYELERNALTCPGSVLNCGGAAAGLSYLRYDKGTFLLGTLRPQVSWDRRDNIFRPHRGSLMMLRTELVNSLSSDHTVFLLKVDGSISGYLPIGNRITLALSLRGGIIKNLNRDSKTPSHKLFFLGGRNSVRSYEEDNLIPQDQLSCVAQSSESPTTQCISLGGNAYWLAKGEFRFPIISDTLEGALFVDLGNLWMDPQKFDITKLRKAAGFGLRLITPIGPIALDVGFNLSPDSEYHEQTWTVHFNVGVF
jgi:outer membrane protein insertion porin family